MVEELVEMVQVSVEVRMAVLCVIDTLNELYFTVRRSILKHILKVI